MTKFPDLAKLNYFTVQCHIRAWSSEHCTFNACRYFTDCEALTILFPNGVPFCIATRLRYGYCHQHDYRTTRCKNCRELLSRS